MGGEAKVSQERQMVVFTLLEETFAVDISTVREIITRQKVTPLPKSPEFVEGIINLRGRVLPVVDLKKRLRMREAERTHEARIMIVEVGGKTMGCEVDSVKEVMTVSGDIIEPPSTAAGIHADYLEGIAKVGERLVLVMALNRVLGTTDPGQEGEEWPPGI